MKPDWEKLKEQYADSKRVVITDVDCTTYEGKQICTEYGVTRFPTLLYWVKGEYQEYPGEHTYNAMNRFVEDELVGICLIGDLDGCSIREKKYIVKMQETGIEEVRRQFTLLENMKRKKLSASVTRWIKQRLSLLGQIMEDEEENETVEESNTAREETIDKTSGEDKGEL